MNEESLIKNLRKFIEYKDLLTGDEKGEAHVFCDRLFQAFGHGGYREAGAKLEERIHAKNKNIKYADLVWKPRFLLEMKSAGVNLNLHYRQVFEYWAGLVPHRPRYVILCNFDDFWIYDFDIQMDDPVEKLKIVDFPKRYAALSFLLPQEKQPIFGNNKVEVTRSAADKMARVFNLLVARNEDRQRSQRLILQILVALFSEDIGLLPSGLFLQLLQDCKGGRSSYDLLSSLFTQMNNPKKARGGTFQNVDYFNGGLFQVVDPIDFNSDEISILIESAQQDWSKVHPAIFGTLFQDSLEKQDRHEYGAHFTSEVDIQRVVLPTIVKPWQKRIERAETLKELVELREELHNFHVLDPACGSGNFLHVAYRELNRIDLEILAKIYANFKTKATDKIRQISMVGIRQFHGIDIQNFAVELAKITLLIAKELSLKETQSWLQTDQAEFPFSTFKTKALPLDNLDENIRCDDALFCNWPKVQAIIGNPPYQSKNKMQQEFGPDYVNKVRLAFSAVPGRADYCVYWFRRTHDELPAEGRAGLVGTNTIRQNYSREGGLDYIVQNGGTICDAVSTQVWSGDAAVHVSIVNWVKGEYEGKKKLANQTGDNRDSPWEIVELDKINSSLSNAFDVFEAKRLKINIAPKVCFQGQTHGRAGFLLSSEAATHLLQDDKESKVMHPYLTGDDLLGNYLSQPSRFVIDLNHCDNIFDVMIYKKYFKYLEENVLPDVKKAAEDEKRNLNNGPRQQHLRRWWKFWRPRPDMMAKLSTLSRYIACARVTKRPIFEFVNSSIRPNDSLQVFGFDDDYSFGILQSYVHWTWFMARGGTLKSDPRYTPETVFNSFPWPQSPSEKQIRQVAEAATYLRHLRHDVMTKGSYTLRQIYRKLTDDGKNPLRDAQEGLDDVVRKAYGIALNEDILEYLFCLNQDISNKESNGVTVLAPGLPPFITDRASFLSEDCVQMTNS